MLRLLLVFALVHGKTVRYSNVPPRASITTKTYDLEVPGSAPIRIIEAEPIWSTEDIPNTTQSYRDGLEHRTTKSRFKTGKEYVTTQPTRTTISEPITHESEHSEYSPDALNVFLKKYADKVQADRKKYTDDEEQSSEEANDRLANKYQDNSAENENKDNKSWGLVDMKFHNHPFEDKKGWVTLEAVPWSTSKISKWKSNNKNEAKPWENNYNNKLPSHWNFKPHFDNNYENNNNNNNFNSNMYSHIKHKFSNQENNSNDHENEYNNYNDQSSSINNNKHTYENSFNYNKNPFNSNNNNNPNNFNNNKHNFNSNSNNFHASNSNKFNNNNYNSNSQNEQYNPNDNIFFDKPFAMYDVHYKPIPGFSHHQNSPDVQHSPRPLYAYDQKPLQIKPENSDWASEIPIRRPWNKPPVPIFSNKPVLEKWFDKKPSQVGYSLNSHNYNTDDYRDIITDDRPQEFPKPVIKPFINYDTQADRPANNNNNNIHPVTHPDNGNGEWVLVSTTKGYQYPRNKYQRSIEVTSDTIGTRRGIRLTVLPPDADSNINMTTSHGGLLEVESTFESVEESQRNHFERSKIGNKTRVIAHTNSKKPDRTEVLANPKPHRKHPAKRMPVVNPKPDATAVLAAVSAGMVPATMAMLVPFVTGRKRRSTNTKILNNTNYISTM